MQLKKLRVQNFSAFEDTGWIEFYPGINIVIGQNNAGKSALLRVFEDQLLNDKHRNLSRFANALTPEVEVEYVIEISGRELSDAILDGGADIAWPVGGQSLTADAIFMDILEKSSATYEIFRKNQSDYFLRNPKSVVIPGNADLRYIISPKNGLIHLRGYTMNTPENTHYAFTRLMKSKVFVFAAQRYSLGKSGFDLVQKLAPNASNLAGYLMRLQGEQGTIFERLETHMREVFPTIQGISIAPVSHGFEIRVWATSDQIHPELGISLDNCGTGVAQVLAILAIVMTMQGSVIVVDEINSFLHPAAAKSLLRIIQTHYMRHQYIISTHSMDVLNASHAVNVLLVRREGYRSAVSKVEPSDLSDLREIALHLGVSMADVFASDRILWVEGPTEKLCFSYLYEMEKGELPAGLAIIPLITTGDFGRKGTRQELVFQIYTQVSRIAAPLVKMATFSFDREGLSAEQMENAKKEAKDRLRFLPRRHFECYLVDPGAIADFIYSRIGMTVAATSIKKRIEEIGGDRKYWAVSEWKGAIDDEEWLANVNAAAIIKDVVEELTESKLIFRKVDDSLALLKWIYENRREKIGRLVEFVDELFKLAMAD
ncbi:MAG TPA: AAA family ATPase [Methylophilaceae bacterium]|jgi:hypothetical protein